MGVDVTPEDVLQSLKEFAEAQHRNWEEVGWWYYQKGQSFFLPVAEYTVTVVETTNDSAYYDGEMWSGPHDSASFVVMVSASCSCQEPSYYKISGYADSYGGVVFTYPTIKSVQKKTETVSKYE